MHQKLSYHSRAKYFAPDGAIVLLGIGVWSERWLNRAATILFLLDVPINGIGFISALISRVRIL